MAEHPRGTLQVYLTFLVLVALFYLCQTAHLPRQTTRQERGDIFNSQEQLRNTLLDSLSNLKKKKVYLVKKSDMPSFMKRQSQNICCSMDIACFTCGRKKRSPSSSSAARTGTMGTGRESPYVTRHSLPQILAARYGILPIEPRAVTVPADFAQVRLGSDPDTWRNYADDEQEMSRGRSLAADLPAWRRGDEDTEYILLHKK